MGWLSEENAGEPSGMWGSLLRLGQPDSEDLCCFIHVHDENRKLFPQLSEPLSDTAMVPIPLPPTLCLPQRGCSSIPSCLSGGRATSTVKGTKEEGNRGFHLPGLV